MAKNATKAMMIAPVVNFSQVGATVEQNSAGTGWVVTLRLLAGEGLTASFTPEGKSEVTYTRYGTLKLDAPMINVGGMMMQLAVKEGDRPGQSRIYLKPAGAVAPEGAAVTF